MQGYQMKITIKGSKPPVWRRIQIPKDMTFLQLHETLQHLFGWSNVHSYEFTIKGSAIRLTSEEYIFDFDNRTTLIDEEHCLFEYLDEGSTMIYTYDFGNDWKHVIQVEKEIEMKEDYPVLIKWKGNHYAEDAGDVLEYEEMLRKSMDPNDPEQEERKDWLENNPMDFDELHVQKLIQSIVVEELHTALDPVVSDELDQALIKLRDALTEKTIENLSLIIKEKNDQISYIGFNQILDDITLQIYENETDYLQGVDFVSSYTQGNLFANAICIVFSKQLPFDQRIDNNHLCIVKRMKTGYLPMELTAKEAIKTTQELLELVEVIHAWKQPYFPTYDTNECLYATWSKDHFDISKQLIRLNPERTLLHIHPKDKAEIEEQAAHRKGVTYVDLIGYPSYKNFEMDLILVLEGTLIESDETLDRSSLQSFRKMNEEILYHMCDFLYEDGIPDKILVNNENLRFMLSGLCDDLKIAIAIEPFITQTEKDLREDSFENSTEDDLEILETMAGMENDEFFDFVQHMRPEEMADFQEFLKKYIDLDELEKIFEEIDELNLDEDKKKTFDA